LEYSFKNQYVADTDIKKDVSGTAFGTQTHETMTDAKLTNFFTFIESISKDGSLNPDFLTELNSDADILKEVENNITWKIIPAQNTPYDKLDRQGIELADKTKTTLYLNDKSEKAVKFNITEGLKS